MKKQSHSVQGKRRDDGLPAAARKERDSEIRQQTQKKAKEKEEGPGSSVAPCPSLSPSARVPGASPITLAVSPVRSRVPAPIARPPPRVCGGPACASYPSGSLSPPGPLLGVTSAFYSCGAHPKVLKVTL